MNLNWSNRIIKYVLFVFNLLFVVSGIVMIAVGVSVKSYFTEYDIFLNNSYFSLPNLLIAIGSLIFFISFFGCCGAIRESWFMIFIFSVLLSIIFIMEFSAGIAGYVLRDKTTDSLKDALLESMQKYQFNPRPNITVSPFTIMWDTIQYEFECCGAIGPQDWPRERPNRTTTTEPPIPTTVTTTPEKSDTTTPTSSTSVPPSSISIETPLPPATTPIKEDDRGRRAAEAGDNNDLPVSCCKGKNGATGQLECTLNNSTTSTINNDGCVNKFGNYLKDHAVTLGGVGIAIAIIQLFGIIFACHLTKQLKHGFIST